MTVHKVFFRMVLISIFNDLFDRWQKIWMYCLINALIVLHAYGGKTGIYDDNEVARNILSAVCYAFLFGSFCSMDKVMQGIISKDARAVYADSTPYIFTCSIVAVLVFMIALIRKLWLKRALYGILYLLCCWLCNTFIIRCLTGFLALKICSWRAKAVIIQGMF